MDFRTTLLQHTQYTVNLAPRGTTTHKIAVKHSISTPTDADKLLREVDSETAMTAEASSQQAAWPSARPKTVLLGQGQARSKRGLPEPLLHWLARFGAAWAYQLKWCICCACMAAPDCPLDPNLVCCSACSHLGELVGGASCDLGHSESSQLLLEVLELQMARACLSFICV